ncbi:Negative regulator of mitotic exit, partial [Nowakowskiella sp. JEL0078]
YGHSALYIPDTKTVYIFVVFLVGLPIAQDPNQQLSYSITDGKVTNPMTDLSNTVGNPMYANCIYLPVLSGVEFGGFNAICIGGADPTRVISKPYVFNTVSQKWAPLLTTTLNLPLNFQGTQGAVFESNVVFFGGIDSTSNQTLSTIYSFGPFPSLTDHLVVSGASLGNTTFARAYGASASVLSGIVLGFGSDGKVPLSSVVLITRSSTITVPSVIGLNNGPLPSAREGVTAVNVTSTKVLFYGGRAGSKYFNEVWELDTANNVWTWFLVSTESGSERAFHTSTMVGRIMFVCGGLTTGAAVLDDQPVFFDTTLRKWISFPSDFFAVVSPPPSLSLSSTKVSQITTTSTILSAIGTNTGNDGQTDVFIFIGLGIFIGIAVIVTVIVFFLRRQRKKKTNVILNEEPPEDSILPPPYELLRVNDERNYELSVTTNRTGSARPRIDSMYGSRNSVAFSQYSMTSGTSGRVTSDVFSEQQLRISTLSNGTSNQTSNWRASYYSMHHPSSGNPSLDTNDQLSPVSDIQLHPIFSASRRDDPGNYPPQRIEKPEPFQVRHPINESTSSQNIESSSGSEDTPSSTQNLIATFQIQHENPAQRHSRFQCRQSHIPRSQDELNLNTGDEGEILEYFEDGWVLGSKVVEGATLVGFFPSDAVAISENLNLHRLLPTSLFSSAVKLCVSEKPTTSVAINQPENISTPPVAIGLDAQESDDVLSSSFFGASSQPFPKETQDILLAPVSKEDVEIKPGN